MEFFVAQIRSQKVNFRAASRYQPYATQGYIVASENAHNCKLYVSVPKIAHRNAKHGAAKLRQLLDHRLLLDPIVKNQTKINTAKMGPSQKEVG